MSRTITATRLKARLLAVLDEVAETGEAIVVTKHGKPVARLEPAARPPSLAGSVTFLVDDDELVAPIGDAWDATHP